MDDANPWLAAVVECSDDAIITKTLQGVITGWNAAAERLFGYQAGEAVGRPVAMLVPSDRAEEEPRILARILNGERVDHFETERVRKDGSVVAVSVTISPVRDAAGRIVGASKIARDISERKKADARVQAQLARLFTLDQITRAIGEQQDLRDIHHVALRAVEERMPVEFACMCTVDAARRQLLVAHLEGRSSRLAAGMALSEHVILPLEPQAWERWTDGSLVYLNDLRHSDTSLARRLSRGGFGSLVIVPLKALDRIEAVMVCARREVAAFSSTDCEFLLQLGTHVALAVRQARLVASLQKAYDDLRASQESAARQERLRALGEMASGVAHDIGNLVFPAAFFAEELTDNEPGMSANGVKTLALIKGCLDDVAAIVQRLRDFHRAREVPARSEQVDLAAILDQVVELTRPNCAARSAQGVRVDVKALVDDAAPAIAGSESEIREALFNLVLNAVDAMPDGGTVGLRLRRGEPGPGSGGLATIDLRVEDTGIGMDEDTRRRCMEPFFTTKGDSGTGLGMSMVYGVIQRHGAELSIESAPDKGTTVCIRFPYPRAPSPPHDARVAEALVPAADGHALRILLIDDDPLVLETLEHLLQQGGHSTTASPGGRPGIEAFREALGRGERFDVVVTDLGMPDVDGKAVARSIKRLSACTPVVLLTGWGEMPPRQGESRPHVDAVLGKPPTRGDLEQTLARVTRASEAAS